MPNALHILVIDDDPVMRELLEAVLGFAGHAVECLDSGEKAVAKLESCGTEPDVVLTDLHMPGLQGHALAERLLALRRPGTVLVGMSGSFPSDDEKRLLDHFLQKPFTTEQLDVAVERARARQSSGGAASQGAAEGAPDGRAAGVLNESVFVRLADTVPAPQLRELYMLTLDDVQARVEAMIAAARAGDVATVRREAHAIKGGCGMVGAAELYNLASTTEEGTDTDMMPLTDFGPACERLKRMLDERLSS